MDAGKGGGMTRSAEVGSMRDWDAVAAEFCFVVRIRQNQLPIQGIWWDGFRYHLVVKDATLESRTALAEWLRENKPLTLPLVLSKAAPPESIQIAEHSAADHAAMKGVLRTYKQLRDDLCLRLPPWFPAFVIADDARPMSLVLSTTRTLDESEVAVFLAVARDAGLPLSWRFVCEPPASPSPPTPVPHKRIRGGESLDIVPTRLLSATLPFAIRRVLEEDESNWTAWGSAGLAGDFGALPPEVRDQSSVLVEAETFEPPNIRNFLVLYRKVVLLMPLAERYQPALRALGLTEAELVELFRLGRLDVLLPQPIHRYPLRVLAQMAEIRPAGLVGSRTLALKSMKAVNTAFPLAFLAAAAPERQVVLAVVKAFAKHADEWAGAEHVFLTRWVNSVASHLEFVWSDVNQLVHRRGAMAVGTFGHGPVLASSYRARDGVDRDLEFFVAARSVEYAMAMQATVAPCATGYDHPRYVETVAGVYSNRDAQVPVEPSLLRPIVGQVLSVDKDVPVLDLATAFEGSEIDRLRDIISDVAAVGPEEIETAVLRFNREVRAYEKREKSLAWWQIKGVLFAAGTVAVGDITAGATAEIIRWGVERIIESPYWHANRAVSEAADTMRSAVTGSRPRAVLVARMRKKLAE